VAININQSKNNKNMKVILKNITMLASFAVILFACSSDGDVRDTGVTAVQSLYEPIDGKAIVLQASAQATQYFEWEPARAEDSGNASYEIAFERADGDFSKPLMILVANSNGGASNATVTHKQLNSIAAQAGIESSAQGSIKWTVFSSKDYNPVKATEERTITVTRLAGFADIPAQLYITGEATEAGANLADALVMKKVVRDGKIAEGEFEIYTQLTAGKTFKFVSDITGTPKEYSVSGEKLLEGGTSTVATTGIYKYYVDFTTGAFSTKEVTRVSLFVNAPQLYIDLPYKGFGVWELLNYTAEAGTINSNDDRYKFRMNSSAGETEWRTAASNDSKPSGNAAYYYMQEKNNVEQWTNNEIWKSPSTDGWDNKTYDFSFSLNPEVPYTHSFVIK
jgi:hypothetical protein